MEIVIAAGGMSFGPNTLAHKSLGGSETAVIEVARELGSLGHLVTVFCPLPPEGSPDFHPNGAQAYERVRYVHIEQYKDFVTHTPIDLLIVSRDPRLIAIPAQAKKKVLWMHDVATMRGMQSALDQMSWTFDEIWTVSEDHRQQVHKVTGYPLSNIVAMRNGIVRVEVPPVMRLSKQLVYAARPERGLENLIKVMKYLPDYTLKVCMYAHFPEEMRQYYAYIHGLMKQQPNIEFVGSLTQQQLRVLIAESAAYIYPTEFVETSCIIARECIEQRTPFITTKVGALPETLGECGSFFDNPDKLKPGSDEWCQQFAHFADFVLKDDLHLYETHLAMDRRTDLYWDGVAKEFEKHSAPLATKRFSRAWSLIQDGDVIAAKAYLEHLCHDEPPLLALTDREADLYAQIINFYPFLLDPNDSTYMSIGEYYKNFYEFKKPEIIVTTEQTENARFQHIMEYVKQLPDNSLVVEYGCGEGHVLLGLAKKFPRIEFFGLDQVQANVDRIYDGIQKFELKNVSASRCDAPQNITGAINADLVICTEVLEHCVEPWHIADGVERLAKQGGRIVITTPQGAWEPASFNKSAEEWPWRNHIWHLDKPALRLMFVDKPHVELTSMGCGIQHDARSYGHLAVSYLADHNTKVHALDPLSKALAHHSRHTCAAALIAYNNEDTILRMLNSIASSVQHIRIAHGPSTDATLHLVRDWAEKHPHISVEIIDVPKIEPAQKKDGVWVGGYGFDDARNQSVLHLDFDFDWVFWIDTDEYLSGDFRKYLRWNCLDGYLIPQHHFTVQPREAPAQMDRPARLFRTNREYKSVGHIHEHFERPDGGPGHCYMPHDVDIGHTGYVNEDVRKARFERNFPFLVWDHETNPDRKLGKYLWLRDIIHRMRFCVTSNHIPVARQLAEEAIQYYEDNWSDMSSFGQGTFLALGYVSEARGFLGQGVPLAISVKLDDRHVSFEARYTDIKQLQRILNEIIEPELKRRQDRYY